MSDTLTRDEAMLELTQIWEEQATSLEKFDKEDRAARTLRMCAEDVRKTTEEHAEEWVPHATIRQRTGWSDLHLRRIYKRLEETGRARKHRGHWQVLREAAMDIAVKHTTPSLEGLDISEMARVLGRS